MKMTGERRNMSGKLKKVVMFMRSKYGIIITSTLQFSPFLHHLCPEQIWSKSVFRPVGYNP